MAPYLHLNPTQAINAIDRSRRIDRFPTRCMRAADAAVDMGVSDGPGLHQPHADQGHRLRRHARVAGQLGHVRRAPLLPPAIAAAWGAGHQNLRSLHRHTLHHHPDAASNGSPAIRKLHTQVFMPMPPRRPLDAGQKQPAPYVAVRREACSAAARCRKKKQFLKKWVTEHMEESEARRSAEWLCSSQSLLSAHTAVPSKVAAQLTLAHSMVH